MSKRRNSILQLMAADALRGVKVEPELKYSEYRASWLRYMLKSNRYHGSGEYFRVELRQCLQILKLSHPEAIQV